jgi:exosortase B
MSIGSGIITSRPDSVFVEWFPVLLGLVVLFGPTYFDLANTLWMSENQAHGPIIFCVVLYYFWQKRHAINTLETVPSKVGWAVFIFGLLLYVIGRSQSIQIFEVGSQIVLISGLLLILRGWASLRAAWFPLFFLIFMIPLPGALVDALTLPMKMAVSYVAEQVLFWVGYPIARSGVTLQIGQYKLLVADACAGLHTLFTLEALGLLYLNMVRHDSLFRNVSLAILIVPISFSANVIRVMVLTLITYHLGDAAGQGFLHGFAGMVLFITALLLIVGTDSLLQIAEKHRRVRSAGLSEV